MLVTVLRTVGLSIVLAAGLGCAGSGVAPPATTLAFYPTHAGEELWLTTPFAVELTNERDARVIEAIEAMYVGGLSGEHVCPARLAAVAAERGATHFRVVTAGDALRVDVLLYRVARERWSALPEALRPTPPS